MPNFHFLNVRSGDCKIIQHASGRVTMKDICNANASRKSKALRNLEEKRAFAAAGSGNFGMCAHPTHPLDYLDDLGIKQIWRFILSHPDMDHMDGLDALFQSKEVVNYWDSGVRRMKPDFGTNGRYQEKDWDRYESILSGYQPGLTVLEKKEGDRFAFANQPNEGHDGLYILSPNSARVRSVDDETNDASYVTLYRSPGGKILLPGDAHDETWKFVLENHYDQIKDCAVLVAPHHGRDSTMDFSFLDVVNPKLVLMGCAGSKDLAYDKYRKFEKITNNQAGNVVLETDSYEQLHIYVQNDNFALSKGCDGRNRNSQGYIHYGVILDSGIVAGGGRSLSATIQARW